MSETREPRVVACVECGDTRVIGSMREQLILAAPDLYEALSEMVHEYGRRGAPTDELWPPEKQLPWVRKAMTALLKATGEQP